jgi:predicted nucleic acid-binding protein
VRLVVTDTGPVNYLILIGHIDLLPRLFERVVLPRAVLAELSHPLAPASVQRWIAAAPVWLEVAESPAVTLSFGIHKGEAAAIALASAFHADLLLIDDRKGVLAAEKQGLNVTGTLGVLDLAAERGLVDFAQAATQLKQTTFRMPLALRDNLIAKHARKKET